jgi:hypothetical protein
MSRMAPQTSLNTLSAVNRGRRPFAEKGLINEPGSRPESDIQQLFNPGMEKLHLDEKPRLISHCRTHGDQLAYAAAARAFVRCQFAVSKPDTKQGYTSHRSNRLHSLAIVRSVRVRFGSAQQILRPTFFRSAGPCNRRWNMRITIRAPGATGTELQADNELRRAFGVLRGASIPTRGGGRFADGSTGIILSLETDAPRAVAALKEAGIRAL